MRLHVVVYLDILTSLCFLHGIYFQMSVGERATLTCSSDCAYGERGHPGVYPLNSNLKIVIIIIKTYIAQIKLISHSEVDKRTGDEC